MPVVNRAPGARDAVGSLLNADERAGGQSRDPMDEER
jgi:hypothetical protein